jgi:hypothetical protein
MRSTLESGYFMSPLIGLPNSLLLETMKRKLEEYKHLEIDFLGIVNALRKQVSQEISYINLLFPEYTPHDENYHLKNLFNIADKLLDESIMDSLSGIELFVLAASIYGHDWGMAVSNEEKNHIEALLNGKETTSFNDIQYNLINNEIEILREFCIKKSIEKNENDDLIIPLELWQEYVRNTHAIRSGQRVFNFIKKHNQALAVAVQHVCIGHWLDFSEVRNPTNYPEHYSILNDHINLRALTIYIRLIDLLDITEDRTPYMLWKFVSPNNAYSKMEWNKHRAIHAFSIAPYQNGRKIIFNGNTDDHDVFAALNDLKHWINNQLKGCNDVIAELLDNKYRIDIYHIDWLINATGFEPIPIKVEFNRDRMLNILSEEIYDNDPYVFLRELLQNSMDAIRARKALLETFGLIGANFGRIVVDVERIDGNLIISFKDNGIGMDSHIIQTYLSVAGNSYYSSNEFKETGIKIDPISKFGVGLLSCNSVADYIEIETKRDPYLKASKKFKIKIPSFKLHFRVESYEDPHAEVGTTVKVYVNERELSKKYKLKNGLKVTEYISHIAGFVDIPIMVIEDGLKTLITHPKQDEEEMKRVFGEDVVINKVNLAYDWENSLLVQDLKKGKQYFEEIILDVNEDLKLDGYEGTIAYLKPIDSNINYVSNVSGVNFENEKGDDILVRKHDGMYDFSRYLKINRLFKIYRDGVFLSGINSKISNIDFLPIKLNINISKLIMPSINIARTNSIGENCIQPIYNSFINYLLLNENNSIKASLELAFGSMHKFVKLNPELLTELEMPFLNNHGEVFFEKIEGKEIIRLLPEIREKDFKELFLNSISETNVYRHWVGGEALITNELLTSNDTPISASKTNKLIYSCLERFYYLDEIILISSPTENFSPIVQEIWKKIPDAQREISVEQVFCKIRNDNILTRYEEYIIQQEMQLITYSTKVNKITMKLNYNFVYFPEKQNQYFSYGGKYINLNHDIGKRLFDLYKEILIIEKNNDISFEDMGLLNDAFELDYGLFGETSFNDFNQHIRNILEILLKMKIKQETVGKIALSEEDFVPASFENIEYRYLDKYEVKDFGELI